ncbi:MAG: ABC transporter ATP-binding protein [Desulfurococcales archaeon]|nr:ABC transporter ATP-binding protein [Desulfurococcales archaeon]
MALLDVENVTKRFGGIIALNRVSLTVESGEFVGLIGPNGSGKTTLVNVVTGVYKPEEGRIAFQGSDITGKPSHLICRLGISRTFQIPQPIEDMTVYENVALSNRFCGDGKDETVWEALKLCGLEDKAYVEAGRLILVEKRLLELARAIATRPRLLFLDEVAAGLRPGEIRHLASVLRDLNSRGISIVWIEHNIVELVKYVRRVVVMHFGRVIADGDPSRVLRLPEVVESYLGRLAV